MVKYLKGFHLKSFIILENFVLGKQFLSDISKSCEKFCGTTVFIHQKLYNSSSILKKRAIYINSHKSRSNIENAHQYIVRLAQLQCNPMNCSREKQNQRITSCLHKICESNFKSTIIIYANFHFRNFSNPSLIYLRFVSVILTVLHWLGCVLYCTE